MIRVFIPRFRELHPGIIYDYEEEFMSHLDDLPAARTQEEIDAGNFISAFNHIARGVEEWAERKGWNKDDPRPLVESLRNEVGDRLLEEEGPALIIAYDLSKYALFGTEIAEAIEGLRHGDPASDKIPEFTVQEEELADTIIRIMHYFAHRKLRVAEALVAKLAFNEGRPYKHGKLA